MNSRLQELRREIAAKKLDAMLINAYESYCYFSGFRGSNCYLIITQTQSLLITDGRYTEQAKLEAPDFTLISRPRPMHELICETLSGCAAHRVGYESMKITDYEISALKKKLPQIEWVPQIDFGVRARMCKDEGELSRIRRAVEIADQALLDLIPSIHPGMRENEISALLEYHMARRGSEHPAFETIVASGPRGALPHGAPTDRCIETGEMVTIDFGACFAGYMSDITRTLWIVDIPDELRRIWDAVLDVQRACVSAVRPDIPAKSLDVMQRDLFEKKGLAQYVQHSLGHGVGLEIHEAPSVSASSTVQLAPGMVITIEPGLYLPGIGGVRIEDTVLVTADGHEVLTASPHHIKIDCNVAANSVS